MPHLIRFHLTEGALPMLDGETLEAFREAIVFALREDYEARGVITRDAEGMRMGWVYVIEVFDDFAVVEIEQSGIPGYHEKVTFTRAPDGTFTLGEPVRVRRKVEWEPVGEVEADEGATLPDREREIGAEITTETIGSVGFPVGDPEGMEHAAFRLKLRLENEGRTLGELEKGQIQSAMDRTQKRAGSAPRIKLR